jgi:kynurenine formamidase
LLEDGNLDALEDKQVKRLFIIPLMLEGLEAAPVTAVAEV